MVDKLIELNQMKVGFLGIPAHKVDNLFTEFGRTSVRPTSGERSTGLGLAIFKIIVELHGGRIWVESMVDMGSTLHLRCRKRYRRFNSPARAMLSRGSIGRVWREHL